MAKLGKHTEFTIPVLWMLDDFFKSKFLLSLGIDCLIQDRKYQIDLAESALPD